MDRGEMEIRLGSVNQKRVRRWLGDQSWMCSGRSTGVGMELHQWDEGARGQHCVSHETSVYRRTSLLQRSRMKASWCHDRQRVSMEGLGLLGACGCACDADEIRNTRATHRSKDRCARARALEMPISHMWDGRYVRTTQE